jgi:hypothetical protein
MLQGRPVGLDDGWYDELRQQTVLYLQDNLVPFGQKLVTQARMTMSPEGGKTRLAFAAGSFRDWVSNACSSLVNYCNGTRY